MPLISRRAKRTVQDAPGITDPTVSVLDDAGYEVIRKKPKTVDIFLSSALFPARKVTTRAIKEILSRKGWDAHRRNSSYNAVFHVRSKRKDELTAGLKQVREAMQGENGRWFIVVDPDTNRGAAEKRARAVVSRGKVRLREINRALAAYSGK